jgi:DNA polymerase-3 subunit alpha
LSFIHLHVYSSYSLLSSTANIRELVRHAKAKGFSAIALTDKNVMYGAIAFYKECLQQSLKPIIGLCADIQSEADETKAYPLVLLAKNQTGFQNLLKITSAIQATSQKALPIKWLRHYAKGIIALTPGIAGEIENSLLNGKMDEARKQAQLFNEIFGSGHFYLSLQDHGMKEEKILIKALSDLGKSANIPLVATNEVQYLEKEDAFAHECLLAIKEGKKLNDEDRHRLKSNEYFLKTAGEMTELFIDEPDALENTLKISEMCNVHLHLGQKMLPKFPVGEGQTADGMLEQLCRKGFAERYPHPTPGHKQRLEYELAVIQKMNFSDYFLIVWDFMRFAREQGILTGPGRGSAAGSMVAYVLYITDIDPIRHGLLFERFLNPERINMPDIDIDFPDHRREEVIQYVANKYGHQHVARIITFGTLAAKAAIKDVGRVFGLNPKELDQLSSLIPSRLGITLNEAYEESEALRRFVFQSPLHQRLFATAKKLEGLPRHASIHAAGVVISEKPLVQTIPIQSGHNGVYLTQYSMEFLEDAGLIKMDFLGLRNLSFMEAILAAIYRQTRKWIDIRSIPLDDRAVYELLGKGRTTGIFQLESEGMRKVLMQLKPSNFEDIVAVNALYRPGPMENIPLYIERKNGRKKISYPHPDLEPILKNTYGVIVYQEQIMQIASKMAGFSLGEADLLRRAVSKKQKETLDGERKHFVTGALKNGYNEKTANDIYDLIVRFANYGFNRSHAVAYSMIAYQLAYLKAHYPLYFMASLLTSAIGNEAKLVQYIRELGQMGVRILPPSINKSEYAFKVENGAIRYGLLAIKGIGKAALKEIFHSRQRKPFSDLFDFCLRVSTKAVNRKMLEALVHSGSFDEFGQDRAVLLASLDVAIEHAQFVMPDDTNQIEFFTDELFIKPKYVMVDPIKIEDKLALEKEVLGLFLSDHPISVFQKQLTMLGIPPLADIYPGMGQVVTAVYVSSVRKIRTRKGEAMAFLTLSDQSGELEAVMFPSVFKVYGHLVQQGKMLALTGKMEERAGKLQFIIKSGKEISDFLANKNKSKLYLKLEPEKQTPESLQQLKKLIRKHHGDIPVVLYYEGQDKTVLLSEKDHVNGADICLNQLKELLGTKNVILK